MKIVKGYFFSPQYYCCDILTTTQFKVKSHLNKTFFGPGMENEMNCLLESIQFEIENTKILNTKRSENCWSVGR